MNAAAVNPFSATIARSRPIERAEFVKEEAQRSLDQVWVNRMEQRALRRILVRNGLAGKSLLDVPCGYGRFWANLDSLDIRLIGIDRDWQEVHKTIGLGLQGEGSRAACGDIFNLPFADNSFDSVLCVRLLHLNYSDAERLEILREVSRVSRRFVIISIYRFNGLHALMRRFNGTPGRLRLMTTEQLRELCQSSGLRIHSLQPLLPALHMQTLAVLSK